MMATWVTHLMIADRIMEIYPQLDRRSFCAGSIAPDCNVENADWTAFTPSREVTHWMENEKKTAADCDRFCTEYLLPRIRAGIPREEDAFLLGYYAHLIADAEFQRFIRDPERIAAVWERIKADSTLRSAAAGMAETWDNAKKLISKDARLRETEAIEADYLTSNPDSGYLTEILSLKDFPDYIDYLPHGCIERKIGVMGSMPRPGDETVRFLSVSRDEYADYVCRAVRLVADSFIRYSLIS